MGKLVRDRIPELIQQDGRIPMVRHLNPAEIQAALLGKLREETAEVCDHLCIEEIVDVLEVLFALAHQLGYDEATVLAHRHAKRQQRGGFEHRVWLDAIHLIEEHEQ